MSKAQPDGMQ